MMIPALAGQLLGITPPAPQTCPALRLTTPPPFSFKLHRFTEQELRV